ncbi:MAG TPA: bacterioferritin [Nannocystaceae bacterium]|nr:bacterioferritin [Nannocystaceae bacterium]
MKGSPNVIDALNDILTAELTAVNQYFLHAKMCKNWGYARLHEHIYKESIDEMKHADEVIERILFLEGVPNVQRYGKISVGETVPEQLELDVKMEYDAVARFRKAIRLSRDEGDETTAEMLEHMLESEEKHVDWLETQLSLLTQLGTQHYLAQQIRE